MDVFSGMRFLRYFRCALILFSLESPQSFEHQCHVLFLGRQLRGFWKRSVKYCKEKEKRISAVHLNHQSCSAQFGTTGFIRGVFGSAVVLRIRGNTQISARSERPRATEMKNRSNWLELTAEKVGDSRKRKN